MLEQFTQGELIFIAALLIGFLIASTYIKSFVSTIAWGFIVLSLVSIEVFEFPQEWFWISVMIYVISMIISMGVYVFNNERI